MATVDNMASGSWVQGVRAVTLVLAAAVVAILFLYPYSVGPELTTLDRAILPFVVLAVGAAIAYGLGFQFKSRIMNLIVSPVIIWPALVGGLVVMIMY